MIPHGKLTALIIVSLCLVAGAFYYAEKKNSDKNSSLYTAKIQTTDLVKNTADAYKDTDKDGLMDWEEVLLGTDPNVPDADKAKKTSDVLVKRPTKPLTATDSLARSFFSQYMNLKQVGLANDKQSQSDLAENTISSTVVKTAKEYTLSSISISDSQTLRSYGNALGSIFIKNKTQSRNEAVILKEAITTNDKSKLDELIPIKSSYDSIVRELLILPVPKQLSEQHLELINSIYTMSFIISLFQKSFIDPITSMQGVAMYQNDFEKIIDSMSAIRNNFTSNNITFSPDEPGYFLIPKK